MFGPKDRDPLEVWRDRVIDDAMDNPPEEAIPKLKLVRELEEIRAMTQRGRLDPNKALLVAGNLAGILVVVAFEQRHIFSETAKRFLIKPD